MNVSEKGNQVLSMDVAKDDTELFVVTENGFGKRTSISEYPVKGRGTKGVKTIQLTDRKGALAGALIVREHQELLFISEAGMVQRTSVRGISRMGRPTQGVKVMNVRNGDRVSAVALVVESEAEAQLAADVSENGGGPSEDGAIPPEASANGADGSES
jgi:DNA gyrase subunit A